MPPARKLDVSLLLVDQRHMVLVVAVTLHADAAGEFVQVGQFVGGERQLSSAGVLLDAGQTSCPGDRDDRRVLGPPPRVMMRELASGASEGGFPSELVAAVSSALSRTDPSALTLV